MFFSELHFNIIFIPIFKLIQMKRLKIKKKDYKQTSNILNKRSEKIVVNDSI